MKFSVCIPNFNYGDYIGETIDSVLKQDYPNFEVLISDNKSTDNSWEVIQQYVQKDSRVKARQNITNLGFAGNLDPASEGAIGEYMILLSSDDLINQGALAAYKKLIDIEGSGANVICASTHKVDSEGKIIGYIGPNSKIWNDGDIDAGLSEKFGAKVYKAKSAEILKRCFNSSYAPFNFAATCYHKNDYEAVGKYGGSRLMNPDKWFHLRLLANTGHAYFIDAPLFSYRWHQTNQTALQKQSGALKFFIDEYRTSFEVSAPMLEKAGLTPEAFTQNFVHNVIHKHTFRQIGEGNPMQAFRILCWGFAAYPAVMFKKAISYILFLLVILGPLGSVLLKLSGRKFKE